MKLSLYPELVPAHIDGVLIQSDFRMSRFSALAGSGAEAARQRAENSRAELEMNLVVRGRADYLIGEQRVRVDARNMLWILPRQNRLVLQASPEFSAWVMIVRWRIVGRVLTTGGSLPLRRNGSAEPLLGRLSAAQVKELAALYASVPVGSGRDPFNAGLAYALARSWLAYQTAKAVPLPAEVHPAVQKAVWLLRDGGEGLDNTDLAVQAGLSANRLSRLFKRQLGVPLAEFRNRQRLDRVLASLHVDPLRNLLDTALDAGFGSYAQFHRVFRAHFGLSPNEYVRAQKRPDSRAVLGKLGGARSPTATT